MGGVEGGWTGRHGVGWWEKMVPGGVLNTQEKGLQLRMLPAVPSARPPGTATWHCHQPPPLAARLPVILLASSLSFHPFSSHHSLFSLLRSPQSFTPSAPHPWWPPLLPRSPPASSLAHFRVTPAAPHPCCRPPPAPQADFVEKSVPVLPISGWMGDNLIKKSTNMTWWNGCDAECPDKKKVHITTLLEALNDFVQVTRASFHPSPPPIPLLAPCGGGCQLGAGGCLLAPWPAWPSGWPA